MKLSSSTRARKKYPRNTLADSRTARKVSYVAWQRAAKYSSATYFAGICGTLLGIRARKHHISTKLIAVFNERLGESVARISNYPYASPARTPYAYSPFNQSQITSLRSFRVMPTEACPCSALLIREQKGEHIRVAHSRIRVSLNQKSGRLESGLAGRSAADLKARMQVTSRCFVYCSAASGFGSALANEPQRNSLSWRRVIAGRSASDRRGRRFPLMRQKSRGVACREEDHAADLAR
jgi:hypothetical protein